LRGKSFLGCFILDISGAMVAKCKTVSKLVGATVRSKASIKDDVDEETDAQIVPVEEENKEFSEKEIVATRAKELQSMYMDQLKGLLTSNGLDTGKKEVMIKALLKHETKVRVVALEQKAKIRTVVVKKKQELEGSSPSELSKLCDAVGIKARSKEERVQRLLVHWQENDGVDKALTQIAQEERSQELQALDMNQLKKLCNKVGVDPFVKEIMVDRISKQELSLGCYSRPTLPQDEAPGAQQIGDMVEALLANEAQRKKEKELKSQQEEKAAQKRKEFKALSIEDLKKRLTKKGLEATGKKDDMVEALFLAALQEDAASSRQSELKSKSLQDLKEILSRFGLEPGSKEHMVKAMLAHETKCQENLKAFEAKIGEAVAQKKEELETKTNAALKDLCGSKSLAVGGGKDDRIERLLDEAQKDGDLDKVVSINIRNKRKEELMSMDKPAVVMLCEKTGVEPAVKDIMVERIQAHESEGGTVIAMANAEAPPAKKARMSKK